MLSDKELSKELTMEYNSSKTKQGVDIDVQVLTSSAWPLHMEKVEGIDIPIKVILVSLVQG